MSYTKGPWEVTETLGSLAITIPHKKIGIAFDIVCHINHNIRKGHPEANANLIASAPTMYEENKKLKALKTELIEELECVLECSDSELCEHCEKGVKSLIAKAKGK